jgi:hypothetical protein
MFIIDGHSPADHQSGDCAMWDSLGEKLKYEVVGAIVAAIIAAGVWYMEVSSGSHGF